MIDQEKTKVGTIPMSVKKLMQILSFVIVVIMTTVCWYEFGFGGEYVPASKHIVALMLVVTNLTLYFLRYDVARWLTGLILVLSTFHLIALTLSVETASFWIQVGAASIATPSIHWVSFFLLIIFVAANRELWKPFYKRVADWFKKDGI